MQDRLDESEICALIDKLVAHALRVFAEYAIGGKHAVTRGVIVVAIGHDRIGW